MDTQLSSNIQLQLPPGFRFHPSDEELIIHYLRNKATSSPIPASIIAEVDLYKYNPWELPTKALFGQDEWYFFTPRDRKYPNGVRPNRAAASGYWKATGTDKPILTSCGTRSIGVKKALVFYKGRPPKGVKTDWIMHEYRLLDSMFRTLKHKGSMRLDDWVLCRVRQKSSIPRNIWEDRNGPSSEPASYSPAVDKACNMTTNSNVEMIKSYLYNDCPLLPYIFASQDFSAISFEGRNKGKFYSSVCSENNSDQKNLLVSVSSSNSLFNTQKRKPIEGNQYEGFLPPSKKLNNGDDKDKFLLSVDSTEMNCCRTEESEDNNFTADQWDSITQYQELNHLAFTES
ncbi:hypothetical protein AAG906_014412 [Vitis piasezkii]